MAEKNKKFSDITADKLVRNKEIFYFGDKKIKSKKGILKINAENELGNFLDKIQSIIDKIHETDESDYYYSEVERKYPYLAKTELQSHEENSNLFSIDFDIDGEAKVYLMQLQKCIRFTKHIGNFSALMAYRKINKKADQITTPKNDEKEEPSSRNSRRVTIKDSGKVSKSEPDLTKKTAKALKKHELIDSYVSLIKFCFDCLREPEQVQSHVTNKYFDVYGGDVIKVRFKGTISIYSIYEILVTYIQYIARSINSDRERKLRSVILSIPTCYGIVQQLDLKFLIEKAGLKLQTLVSRNELNRLFFNTQHQLDSLIFLSINKRAQSSVSRNANLNDSNVSEKSLCDFEIEIHENGNCLVNVLVDDDFVHTRNHIGDIHALTSLLNKISNENTDGELDDKFATLKNHVALIKFCFKHLDKFEHDIEKTDYDYFEVLSTNKFTIRLKKTNEEFNIQDILVKYFEVISKAIWSKTNYKPKYIDLITPMEYEINQQYELKKCIETAINREIRILPEHVLNNLFYRVIENSEVIALYNTDFSVFENRKTNDSILKNILQSFEDNDECIVFTLRNNGAVLVEMVKNDTLRILRGHIGDHEYLKLDDDDTKSARTLHKSIHSNVTTRQVYHMGMTDMFIEMIKFCFGIFYDKSYVNTSTKEELHPVKIRLKNTIGEFTLEEVMVKYFKLILKYVEKHATNKLRKLILITPRECDLLEQFILREHIEKCHIKVCDIISENELNNLFTDVHFAAVKINKIETEKFSDYEGLIAATDLQDAFGIEFENDGGAKIVVLQEGKRCCIKYHLEIFKA